MTIATNDKGEALRLDEGGKWVPTKMATNPQTGEKLVLDGDQWTPIPKEKPNSLVDAARSIPGGLAQGVAGVVGLPSSAVNFASNLAGKLVGRDWVNDTDQKAQTFMGLPTVGQANAAISNVANLIADKMGYQETPGTVPGAYYKPQTTTGRYAETAASFAPAVLGGEASLGARLLGRVLAPEAGSQLAGSAVDENTHPTLHAAASLGGALLGGGLAGGARALGGALLEDVPPEIAAQKQLAAFAGKIGATPESIAQNTIPGRGQLGVEAMGPNGVSLAATLGRRSGATGEALANALTLRASQAPARIMDDYASAAGIHPEAAQGNIDALVDAGRARVKPLFDEALNSAPAIQTPTLQALMERPVIKKAMAAAANDLRNGGEDPSAIGLHFDDAGNITQRLDPTPAAWDLTKKALGQSVERDAFGNRLPDSKSPGNFRIGQANSALSTALSDAITKYGEALKESGDYLSLKSAFDTGQKHILSGTVTAKQVAEHVASMSPAELDAYKGGIANEIFNKAQNARLAPRLLNTPAVQEKLVTALGRDKAQTFIRGVQQEIELAKSGNRMMPGTGSITSDVLLNAGETDNLARLQGIQEGSKALGHLMHGEPVKAAIAGIGAAGRFGYDVAKTGGMNADTRNELGRMLLLPPDQLAMQLKALPGQTPKNASALGRFLIGNR